MCRLFITCESVLCVCGMIFLGDLCYIQLCLQVCFSCFWSSPHLDLVLELKQGMHWFDMQWCKVFRSLGIMLYLEVSWYVMFFAISMSQNLNYACLDSCSCWFVQLRLFVFLRLIDLFVLFFPFFFFFLVCVVFYVLAILLIYIHHKCD